MNTLIVIFLLGGCISTFFLINYLFDLFFTKTDNSLYKKRMNQLKFNEKSKVSDEESTRELIEKITSPVASRILPKFEYKEEKTTKLAKDLELTQWDKYYTTTTYRAMNITLKVLGGFLFLLMFNQSLVFAAILLIIIGFGINFLFSNSVKEKRFKLLCGFPEVIKVIQGNLSANQPLPLAMENSLPYVDENWRILLKEFVINTGIYSQEECIDRLADKVDMFEVREFWSLVKLNLEQGIDVQESFSNQSDKIESLKEFVMNGKIEKRKSFSIIIQGPLLLDMIVVFGLPTFVQMMNSL